MAAYGKGIRLVRRFGKHGPVQNRNKGHKIEGFEYGHTKNGGPWIDGDPIRKSRKGKSKPVPAASILLPEKFRRKAYKTAAKAKAILAPKPKRKYNKSKAAKKFGMSAINSLIEHEVRRRVKDQLSKAISILDMATS